MCVAVDYIGLGRCALHQGDIDQAKYYAQQIEKICKPHMDISNYIYLTFIAEIYHDTGNIEARDNCISDIQSNLNEQIRIMDYFDDFYEYASLLLRIDYHEQFLYLIELLDKLASQAQVANLRRRIRELKIKYYKKIGDTQAYFQETAQFYEDTVCMERSYQAMVLAMMDTCQALEKEREEKSQIAAQNQKLAQKSETHIPIAVAILDIDYFKQYNDNYGHQRGDTCICMIADELKRIAEYEGVSVYRYGGDEFIVIYENLSRERVLEIAEKLKQGIEMRKMAHEYSKSSNIVTISQGICWGYPKKGQVMSDYLRAADDSLYEVKKMAVAASG